MGWRMFLLLVIAVGLALAAMASLFSVDEVPLTSPSSASSQGTDSGEGIRDDSRKALRDVLREIDSDQEAAP